MHPHISYLVAKDKIDEMRREVAHERLVRALPRLRREDRPREPRLLGALMGWRLLRGRKAAC
ncbi:hypothetical protein [Thermoactinospora rubra]|uniref:hypothetical protein n=1 Tax=Thermoactinospora rubra TaxID=1088767 RepID=UPI000A119A44|nr:hypothetical protein [Thermoactinospora rubra]